MDWQCFEVVWRAFGHLHLGLRAEYKPTTVVAAYRWLVAFDSVCSWIAVFRFAPVMMYPSLGPIRRPP